jgi:hypothetical protein
MLQPSSEANKRADLLSKGDDSVPRGQLRAVWGTSLYHIYQICCMFGEVSTRTGRERSYMQKMVMNGG